MPCQQGDRVVTVPMSIVVGGLNFIHYYPPGEYQVWMDLISDCHHGTASRFLRIPLENGRSPDKSSGFGEGTDQLGFPCTVLRWLRYLALCTEYGVLYWFLRWIGTTRRQ